MSICLDETVTPLPELILAINLKINQDAYQSMTKSMLEPFAGRIRAYFIDIICQPKGLICI